MIAIQSTEDKSREAETNVDIRNLLDEQSVVSTEKNPHARTY